jgi:hypothetical protein
MFRWLENKKNGLIVYVLFSGKLIVKAGSLILHTNSGDSHVLPLFPHGDSVQEMMIMLCEDIDALKIINCKQFLLFGPCQLDTKRIFPRTHVTQPCN